MARPRRNNADYFPHDTGMRKDGRITVLRSEFGLEGYAVYCMTLELLTDSEDFTYSLDEVELQIIAADFGVSPDKLSEIWHKAAHLRLLEFSDSQIYCHKLVDRLQPLLDERERQRTKAQRRWEKEGKTEPNESSPTVKHRENNAGDMQSKVEKSKSKVDNINSENFKLFKEVVSLFDQKLFNEKKWLKCYDELIRIDKYSEENILQIVKHFRADSFWSSNFQTLQKLRTTNKEGAKYIDVFADKLKNIKSQQHDNRKFDNRANREPATADQLAKDDGW